MKRATHNHVAKSYDQAEDNRFLLAAGKSELREYKAVYVQSDEVVVSCAP
jgi:hypothetical protein